MSFFDDVRVYRPRSKLAWHNARHKAITASVAGALLGISPYTTLYRLWAEKTERIERDTEENAAMRKGRLLEPAAAEMMKEDHPGWDFIYKRDNAFYYHAGLRIGATPDALAFRPDRDRQGIVQIKIVSEEVLAKEWTDDDGEITPPDWICIQAIMEAKLTGSSWACVYVMAVGRSIAGHMIDVPLHEGVWATLLAEIEKFWQLVDSGAEPSPDWERDAQAVAEVYRRSKPAEVEMDDDALDGVIELFDGVRTARIQSEKDEEILKAKLLHRIQENEVVVTRRYRVKATSSISAAGTYSRRITIRSR